VLVYFGVLFGYVFVYDVMCDRFICWFLECYMVEEVVFIFGDFFGIDFDRYMLMFIECFVNFGICDILVGYGYELIFEDIF